MTTPIESFETEPYRFLSNFWPYGTNTVEHHYQAAKTDDPEWARRIMTAPSPGKAKRLGRQCPMRPTWDQEKVPVMRALLRWKFASDPFLAAQLRSTGDAELIEGNTWGDIFWGVCRGVGENHLGRLLMEIRASL